MKFKQDLDEFIKKSEVENICNYQNKVFESKIQEIKSTVNKIEECFSLRFGEELSDNKYEKELEEIKNHLDMLMKANDNNKKIEVELNKISYKVQVELEKSLAEEKEKLENFNYKIKEELQNIIQNSKDKEEKIKEETENYIEELKQRVDEIAKDARSRTAIGKQEKIIKNFQLNKKEIDNKILDVEEKFNNKIKDLNYEGQNINNSLKELSKTLTFLQENCNKQIDEKFNSLNYEENVENINNKIKEIREIKEQLDLRQEHSENKLDKLEEIIDQKLENSIEELNYNNTLQNIMQLQKKQEENAHNIELVNKELIESLNNNANNSNYDEAIKYINTEIENIKKINNELNSQVQEKIQNIENNLQNYNYNMQIEKINNEIAQIKENNNKPDEEILTKFKDTEDNFERYNVKIQEINDIIAKIKEESSIENGNLEQGINNAKRYFEEKIAEQKENFDDKFKQLKYDKTIEAIGSNLENLQNKINENKENNKENIKVLQNDINKLNIQFGNIEAQVQAALNIVENLTDKFEQINSFDKLQELEIEQAVERRFKAIENKYNKIFENKLKVLEDSYKAKEKIKNNKAELKEKVELKKQKESINNEIKFQTPIIVEPTTNIYKEVQRQEAKEAAETIYNKNLVAMIDKLKNTKIDTKLKTDNKNQILNFNFTDADVDENIEQ